VPTPLNQVATLGTPEPNLVTLQPWDPTLLAMLEKVIRTSDLGLNPVNDGKIYVSRFRRSRRRDAGILSSTFTRFLRITGQPSGIFAGTRMKS